MTYKIKRIVCKVLIGIPAMVLIIGGMMKILKREPEMVMQFLTKAGFGDYITFLGVAEIFIAGVLIYPKTNKLGFLLATGYFGGAFSMEISGSQPTGSVLFLVILWIGMFLKNREMFVNTGSGAGNH
jgi:hypothetical protein